MKDYFEENCAKSVEEALQWETDDLGTAIACELVRGTPSATIDKTLRAGCDRFSDDDCDLEEDPDSGKRKVCPEWALKLAKATPPIRW